MSERKYNDIPQNGDSSRESNVLTSVFRNKVRYQNANSDYNSGVNSIKLNLIWARLLDSAMKDEEVVKKKRIYGNNQIIEGNFEEWNTVVLIEILLCIEHVLSVMSYPSFAVALML
jgi:hypothetical protein